jgi:chromosome segregation ATPase
MRKFAASTRGGGLLLKGLDATSNASFGGRKGGYMKATKDGIKDRTEFAERLLENKLDKEKNFKGEEAKKVLTSYQQTLGKLGRKGGIKDYIPRVGPALVTAQSSKAITDKMKKMDKEEEKKKRREERYTENKTEYDEVEAKIKDYEFDIANNYSTNKGLGNEGLTKALNSGKNKQQAIQENLAELKKRKKSLAKELDSIEEMNEQAEYRAKQLKKGDDHDKPKGGSSGASHSSAPSHPPASAPSAGSHS